MYPEYTTLDEAIGHFSMMSQCCSDAADHLQSGDGYELSAKHARQYKRLVAWLTELKTLKEKIDRDW